MRMSRVYLWTILVLFPIVVLAQGESTNQPSIRKSYLHSYLLDTRDIFIAPGRWDGKDWIRFGAAAGGTLILFSQDEKIDAFFQDHRTKRIDNISRYGLEPWGNWYAAGTLGILYLSGSFQDNSSGRIAALNGIKAYVLGGLFAHIPKLVFGRYRPYQAIPSDPYQFEPFNWGYSSFVSGHSSTNFAVASAIAGSYPDKKWVGWVSYSLATMASLSRVYENKHWSSDVFAGALLGYGIGRLIINQENWRIMIDPSVSGISISRRW